MLSTVCSFFRAEGGSGGAVEGGGRPAASQVFACSARLLFDNFCFLSFSVFIINGISTSSGKYSYLQYRSNRHCLQCWPRKMRSWFKSKPEEKKSDIEVEYSDDEEGKANCTNPSLH